MSFGLPISEYDQRTKFYNKKKELVHAEIMLPSYAPPGYADRATLWNAVEAVDLSCQSIPFMWIISMKNMVFTLLFVFYAFVLPHGKVRICP